MAPLRAVVFVSSAKILAKWRGHSPWNRMEWTTLQMEIGQTDRHTEVLEHWTRPGRNHTDTKSPVNSTRTRRIERGPRQEQNTEQCWKRSTNNNDQRGKYYGSWKMAESATEQAGHERCSKLMITPGADITFDSDPCLRHHHQGIRGHCEVDVTTAKLLTSFSHVTVLKQPGYSWFSSGKHRTDEIDGVQVRLLWTWREQESRWIN